MMHTWSVYSIKRPYHNILINYTGFLCTTGSLTNCACWCSQSPSDTILKLYSCKPKLRIFKLHLTSLILVINKLEKPSIKVAPTICGQHYIIKLSNSGSPLLHVARSGFHSCFTLSLWTEEGTLSSFDPKVRPYGLELLTWSTQGQDEPPFQVRKSKVIFVHRLQCKHTDAQTQRTGCNSSSSGSSSGRTYWLTWHKLGKVASRTLSSTWLVKTQTARYIFSSQNVAK